MNEQQFNNKWQNFGQGQGQGGQGQFQGQGQQGQGQQGQGQYNKYNEDDHIAKKYTNSDDLKRAIDALLNKPNLTSEELKANFPKLSDKVDFDINYQPKRDKDEYPAYVPPHATSPTRYMLKQLFLKGKYDLLIDYLKYNNNLNEGIIGDILLYVIASKSTDQKVDLLFGMLVDYPTFRPYPDPLIFLRYCIHYKKGDYFDYMMNGSKNRSYINTYRDYPCVLIAIKNNDRKMFDKLINQYKFPICDTYGLSLTTDQEIKQIISNSAIKKEPVVTPYTAYLTFEKHEK
jgi:hypothetical protein